jgi:hypothetical protein
MVRVVLFDPVQEPSGDTSGLSPRLATLNGKMIGLFNNGKLNSTKLLEYVAEVLQERFELGGIIRGPDVQRRRGGRPDSQLRSGYQFGLSLEGIRGCDAIILANGD